MKILDIGANDGFWYLQNKDKFPMCNFTLVEANIENENKLKQLNVEYYIECLSDIEKEVDFYITKDSPTTTGASYYRENTVFFSDDNIKIVKIKTKRLDDLFPNRIFNIIKIDVQGSELDIIKGGQRIFSNARKVIMEVPVDGVEYNFGAPKRKDYFDIMQSMGFTSYKIIQSLAGVHEDYEFEK
jgi:FkbM family methyltransferase